MNPIPKSTVIAIVLLALFVAGGGFYWYWRSMQQPAPHPAPSKAAQNAPASGFGSEVYGKVSNPVSGKIPVAVTPVPNPIQGAYKNPFQ